MNKYKIVSLFLAIALLAALSRLVYLSNQPAEPEAPAQDKGEIVFQNILERKSVRSYTSQSIAPELLDTLVRAAMAAPTARDLRPWKFVVVDSKTTLRTLAQGLPYAKMLPDAAAAIIVCGDLSILTPSNEPSPHWVQDCSAATENLLLAAEAKGLGAVWTGVYPDEERIDAVSQALALPEHIIPLNVIPIGYPEGEQTPKDKYNPENVHYNRW